jgi:ATP/maltotriose-dependent transcriptional regulator MalT
MERLEESAEALEARLRHAEWVLHLGEQARVGLETAGQTAWLDRLEREHDNLRHALAFLLEQKDYERVIQLGWAVRMFWATRGHVTEGRQAMGKALAGGDDLAGALRARARCVIALLLLAGGEIDDMPGLLDQAIVEARAAGDENVLGNALVLRGYAATFLGDLDSAERHFREGIANADSRGDRWGLLHGLNGLGEAKSFRGDSAGAMELLRQSECLAREAGDTFTLTINLSMQASIAQLEGNAAQATALLREQLELSGRTRNYWNLSNGMAQLAGVIARQGFAERAVWLFGATAALNEMFSTAPTFSPTMRERHEEALAIARAQLGAEGFAAAWAAGRAMTLDEALAEALARS